MSHFPVFIVYSAPPHRATHGREMYLGPCWQDGGNVIPVNQGWLPGEIKDGSQRFVGWVCQRTITS